MSLAGEWFLVEHVLSGATNRVSRIYDGDSIDWNIVNETVLLAGLAAGCSLMERAALKATNEHTSVLFDIRNALIHNGGDLLKNNKKTALTEAQDYLLKDKHNLLSSEIITPFFVLNGSNVKLLPNVLFAIRICLV